jgi:hypothetical protein
MHTVGEHPVPAGPLAVRWLGWAPVGPARAGVISEFELVFENAGSAAWPAGPEQRVEVSYHWLDDLGNAVVWGELWTPLTRAVAPGETIEQRVDVRAPLRAGPQLLAFDLVDANRYWFSEVGNRRLEVDVAVQPRIERRLAVVFTPGPSDLVADSHKVLAAQNEALVPLGEEAALAHLAPGCKPAPDWSQRVLDAHQSGYAVVAGSIDAPGLRRRRELDPWKPGTGRVPQFAHRLLCPSLIPGAEPSWEWSEVEGLPALEPPAREPWLYDGRIVITVPPRSGRRRG